MSKQLLFTLFLALGMGIGAQAQSSPVGVWKTIDDATGEAKSHVEIYQNGSAYYGKIIKLLQSDPGTLCEECEGDKKNQPVLGMVIIEGLEPYKDFWKKEIGRAHV